MEASSATKIDAWGVCGLFYRPWLNGRFGPPQMSTDADVCVRTCEQAAILSDYLVQHYPWRRWSVSADAGRAFPYGERAITLRLGAVRMTSNGAIEWIVANDEVVENLLGGVIRIQESNAQAYGDDENFLNSAIGRARKMLREYPGLQLTGRIATEYRRRHGTPQPGLALTSYTQDLASAVRRREESSGVSRPRWRGLSDAQVPDAMAIVEHYRTADRSATCIPVPPPGPLPPCLLAQREARRQADFGGKSQSAYTEPVAPPSGFATWLQWMCVEARDAMFREWLLNQWRSRSPLGGADPYLRSVLDLTLYAGMPDVCFSGQQKITHGGWMLDQHLVFAALNLETDGFVDAFAQSSDLRRSKQLRAGLRLGMLHHDIGKIVSIDAPGKHNRASVDLWERTAPVWVDDVTNRIVRLVMLGHDAFGRLVRAITEKEDHDIMDAGFDIQSTPSYCGAMDPETIVELLDRQNISGCDRATLLRILRHAWEADVASVHVLRWVLPVAEDVERLLSKTKAAAM